MGTATITSKGQMTLPLAIRKALGLEAGDKVEVTLGADGTAVLRKDSCSFDELRGIVSIDGSATQIDGWVEGARAAMARGARR